ncbi:MAG: CvpA family protein [Clostridiales bacterium]|nr:CvpA family protein [Clostridiales bacterium]
MFLVVDLVIVAILLLCIFIGYKRGLTGCIIHILSFFIAIVIACLLFKPLSMIIINTTQIDENIQTSVVEMFDKEDNKKDEENEDKSPILKYITEEVENATADKKNEILNEAARQVSVNIINVLSFIILLIVSRIVLIFVRALANLITKLPLIKQCDKIGGIAYGIVEGLILIFIGCSIVTFVATISGNYALLEMVNSSYIGKILLNNNILMELFF